MAGKTTQEGLVIMETMLALPVLKGNVCCNKVEVP